MTLPTMLVTGASRGIGRELAVLAAGKGHDLVLVARSGAAIDELARELAAAHGITATAIACDLSAPDAADRLVADLDARGIVVDVLVNNAGLGCGGRFDLTPADTLRHILDLNCMTLMLLTRALLPGMVERGHGSIVNVASIAGFTAGPMMAAYHASKAFVVSLSMSIRHELLGTGVSVTCVCPGPVNTAFNEAAGHTQTTRIQRLTELAPERVARETYRAMQRRRAVWVPSLPARLAAHLGRHAPLRLGTAVSARALRGVLPD